MSICDPQAIRTYIVSKGQVWMDCWTNWALHCKSQSVLLQTKKYLHLAQSIDTPQNNL